MGVIRRVVLLSIVAASVEAVASDRPAGGFGMDTLGGWAGRVIRVTNLEAQGPGSLRAALEAQGPRLVVFEVGGVIDLARESLQVREPHLTLAGQTAPDPGITLRKLEAIPERVEARRQWLQRMEGSH